MTRTNIRIRRQTLIVALLAVAALLSVATSRDNGAHITTVRPEADATEVEVDTEITIGFEIEIDGETVTPESVQLLDPEGLPVDVERRWEDKWEIVLTPLTELEPNTRYVVRLDLSLLRTSYDDTYLGAPASLGLDHDPEQNLLSYTFTTGLGPR